MKTNTFTSLLLLLFVGLKLTGHIAWPWLWVLSPLWIPVALWLVLIAVGVVVTALKCEQRLGL